MEAAKYDSRNRRSARGSSLVLVAVGIVGIGCGSEGPSSGNVPTPGGGVRDEQEALEPAEETAPGDLAEEANGEPSSAADGDARDGEATPNVAGIDPGENPAATDDVDEVPCEVSVDGFEVSPAIPTVGIVTWSASVALDSATIEFGPADGDLDASAPVDLDEPGYRTLLLGMKAARRYAFRVVALPADGGEACSSEPATLVTGAVPDGVPSVDREVFDEEAVAPGFVVTTAYNDSMAFIFDRDGDPVWWAEAPSGASRARMDWEGKYVWMVRGNQAGGDGVMYRVSMDGLEVEQNVPIDDPHHDLAPLPGGRVAAINHGGPGACSSILEISPDLSIRPIVEDVATIYAFPNDCHPNSILYHPEDDTLTISDRNVNMYVKVTMEGELVWQLGGQNPLGPQIQAPAWNVNHGHQILGNGNFLFFNNNGSGGGGFGGGGASPVVELAIDYDALTATEVFRYVPDTGDSSQSLGDVQRLSNGNTLVAYSNEGVIHEVDRSAGLVQVLETARLGYAMHRESLYGPPPK